MPQPDPETQDWMERAGKREKPYSHVKDNRGLEVLCATGDFRGGNFEVLTAFNEDGIVKWKIVNRSIRLPSVRVQGVFQFGYAGWAEGDLKTSQGNPDFYVDVARNDPGNLHFPVKEATCKFLVKGKGQECVKSVIARNQRVLRDNLESEFYCETTNKTESTIRRAPIPIDYAIVSIRSEEFSAVLDRFPNRKLDNSHERFLCDQCTLEFGRRKTNLILARCLYAGQSKARDLAEAILEDLDPRWIFLVGIAGGYPAFEFSLGDVVIASKMIDFTVWAAIEGKTPEFDFSGGPFHRDVEKLLQHLPSLERNFGDWNKESSIRFERPKIDLPDSVDHGDLYGSPFWRGKVIASLKERSRIGAEPLAVVSTTASSGGLIKDTEVAEEIRQTVRSLADVEMELASFYNAVVSKKGTLPRIVCVRGISDIVGYRRRNDWLQYACHTAASFVAALLRSGLIDEIEK